MNRLLRHVTSVTLQRLESVSVPVCRYIVVSVDKTGNVWAGGHKPPDAWERVN